jgi:hypothetical protein
MSSLGSWKRRSGSSDSSMLTANHRLSVQSAHYGDSIQYSQVVQSVLSGYKTVSTVSYSIVKGKTVATTTTTQVPVYTNKVVSVAKVLKGITTQQHAFNSAVAGRANFVA